MSISRILVSRMRSIEISLRIGTCRNPFQVFLVQFSPYQLYKNEKVVLETQKGALGGGLKRNFQTNLFYFDLC